MRRIVLGFGRRCRKIPSSNEPILPETLPTQGVVWVWQKQRKVQPKPQQANPFDRRIDRLPPPKPSRRDKPQQRRQSKLPFVHRANLIRRLQGAKVFIQTAKDKSFLQFDWFERNRFLQGVGFHFGKGETRWAFDRVVGRAKTERFLGLARSAVQSIGTNVCRV